LLRLPGESPTNKNIMANALSFLFQKYVTIEVRDKKTDDILFYTNKAAISGRSESYNQDSVTETELSFIAIGWRDELPPNAPKNYDKIEPQVIELPTDFSNFS